MASLILANIYALTMELNANREHIEVLLQLLMIQVMNFGWQNGLVSLILHDIYTLLWRNDEIVAFIDTVDGI